MNQANNQEKTRQAAKEAHLTSPVWEPAAGQQPRYYASCYDLGDSISVSSLMPVTGKARDSDKIFEIIPINATEAYIRYTENANSQKMAFSDSYTYLNDNNTNSQYPYDHREHTHVSTMQPGRLLLEGDKWRQIEKIGIRFDTLTPQQTLAQSPEVAAKVVVPQQQPAVDLTTEPAVSGNKVILEPSGSSKSFLVQPEIERAIAAKEKTVESATAQAPATSSLEKAHQENSVESAQPTVSPVLGKPNTPEVVQLTPVDNQRVQDELLKERVYEALIPEEYLELRSFLRNDGFLSNDEINAALRDARLEKGDLVQALSDKGILSDEPALQEKMAKYLWELHEIIQDPSLEKVRADQLYRVQTVQPITGINQATGEENDLKEGKKGDKSFEIVNGGLIANFLHNYKKAYNLSQNPEVKMEKKTRFQWQDVEASLGKMGITKELLQESGNLERLLKGEKTSLLDFKSTYNEQETRLRGKIYLVRQGQEIKPYFQTQKLNLIVPDKYLGLQFSEEDKAALKGKGELGRRVELEDAYTKKKFDAYVGVDKETNSLTVWRAERVFIPMQIKGVDVSADQQEMLRQGGSVRLSGLTSENGQKYDADIQLSAGRRSLSFSPPSEAIKQSIDVKVAKDLGRASEHLQGTSAGIATTKDKTPIQQQNKATAKQKGIDPAIAQSTELVPGGKSERTNQKNKVKKKRPQQEQGMSM